MERSPTLVRRVTLLAASAVLMTACGGSDDDASPTTTDAGSTETTSPDTTAAPETTVAATTTAPPATTSPTTTVPATPDTTTPDTTTPDTTEPATTVAADTTVPAGDDMERAQFCFDSEQAYVFNQVINVLTDPTPEQAEAALSIVAFTIDAAIESAPDGMDDVPRRMADAIAQIDAGFAAYDYDVDAFTDSPEAEAIGEAFAEYENTFVALAGFVETECTPAIDVLDSQAVKLAPQIDVLRDLPLQPIANQAGDIRLFVPVEWAEWIGTIDVEDVTFLEASNDLEQFESSWNVPGVLATVAYVGAGNAAPGDLLDSSSAGPDCTLDSTEPYSDDVYIGELFLLSDCAGVGTDAAVLAVTDIADQSVEVTLEFQFPDGGDRELLDQMLATFAAGA